MGKSTISMAIFNKPTARTSSPRHGSSRRRLPRQVRQVAPKADVRLAGLAAWSPEDHRRIWGISMDPIRRKRENVGKAWKITKNLAGVVQNFIKILWFDSRRVGISPLNQGNMGGWWDLSKQFQRYPIGDETLGMFSNFLDIAILQKSSISSRYICIINIPIYVYI